MKYLIQLEFVFRLFCSYSKTFTMKTQLCIIWEVVNGGHRPCTVPDKASRTTWLYSGWSVEKRYSVMTLFFFCKRARKHHHVLSYLWVISVKNNARKHLKTMITVIFFKFLQLLISSLSSEIILDSVTSRDLGRIHGNEVIFAQLTKIILSRSCSCSTALLPDHYIAIAPCWSHLVLGHCFEKACVLSFHLLKKERKRRMRFAQLRGKNLLFGESGGFALNSFAFWRKAVKPLAKQV